MYGCVLCIACSIILYTGYKIFSAVVPITLLTQKVNLETYIRLKFTCVEYNRKIIQSDSPSMLAVKLVPTYDVS